MSINPRSKRSTATFAPQFRLLVYLRQSIGEDERSLSVVAQRGICERYAVANSLPWDARHEFIDVGFSRDDPNRPEYKRLLAEAREGDLVLVWERSRLGVDLAFVVTVHHLTRTCCARVVVASGDPIDASDMGLVMEHMRGNSDGGELRNIRRRTREKLHERVEKGYVATKLPYGLESYPEHPDDEDSWKLGRIVPAEAAVIMRAVRMYLDEAMGWHKIARTLNRAGIPGPVGKPRTQLMKRGKRAGQTITTTGQWAGSHISGLLVNPTLRGIYTVGERGGKGGKFPPITVEHPEWVIISPELGAQIDAAIVRRAEDMPRKLNATKHALSGIAQCECGSALTVQIDGRVGRKVRTYQCSRHRRGQSCPAPRYRVPAEPIEEEIRSAMGAWNDRARAAIRAATAELVAQLDTQAGPDAGALEAELVLAKAKQARLAKAVALTDGSVDALMDELRAGQADIRRLTDALARARAPRDDAKTIGEQIERGAVQRLDALLAAVHGPDAREALRALFPQGLRMRLHSLSYTFEGEGDVLQTSAIPDGIRISDATCFRGAEDVRRWSRCEARCRWRQDVEPDLIGRA